MSDDQFPSDHVDSRNRWGQTRLIRAVEEGKLDRVKQLVGEGANVYLVDNEHVSARMLAKQKGYEEIEAYLSAIEEQQGLSAEALAKKAQEAFKKSERVRELQAARAAALEKERQREQERIDAERQVWFFSNDLEKREGPFSLRHVRELAEKGEINESTLMWSPDLDDWKLARETKIWEVETEDTKLPKSDRQGIKRRKNQDLNARLAEVEFRKNHIPVSEFAKSEGMPEDQVVQMIRDGHYVGQIRNDDWFVRIGEPIGQGGSSSFGSAANAQLEKSSRPRPSGVGGWLMFLIIGMMVLGPLLGAGSLAAGFLSAENQYPEVAGLFEWHEVKRNLWIGYGILVAVSFFGGLGLAKERTRSAVMRAKVALWLSGPVGVIVLAAILHHGLGDDAVDGGEVGLQLLASILAALIWTVYLGRSKRVRNTYR